MASNNGSIDEIIGQKGFDDVEQITQKMNTLYVAFKQNVTAINLMNDALSKATTVKDVTGGIDNITTKTKKANQVVTEFIETQSHLDKAVTLSGHALNDQELAYAKLTATMGNGNKAAKLVTDETKKQSVAVKDLEGNYKRLQEQHKQALATAREMGVVYGVSSRKFKDAAFEANSLGKQLNGMNMNLGIHNSEVGKYSEGVTKGLNNVWGGIRKLAYILPGIGIAGIFAVAADAIGEAVDKLSAFGDKASDVRHILGASFDSSEMKTAIENAKKLSSAIELVGSGVMDKKAGLDLYNDTLGKVAGSVTTWDEAEKNIKAKLPAYIQFVTEKANANAFLMKSAELTAEAQKEVIDPSFLTKMEALASAFRSGSSWADAISIEADVKALGLKEKAKKYLDEYQKYYEAFQKTMKDNKFVDPDTKQPTPKTDKPKEVNRIDDLKKEFEAEKLVIETANEKGFTTELEYRNKLLALIKEYVTAKENALGELSKHEKESQTIWNLSLLRETKSNTSAIEKYYADQLKMMESYDAEVKKNDDIKVKDKQTVADKYAAIDDALWAAQFARTQKQLDDAKEKAAAEIKLKRDKATLEEAILKASFSIANSISDAIYAKELQQIEDKATALDEAHAKEIKQIEQSGLTSIQQTKAKAKADAQYEAEKKKIDKDRRKALHNEAVLNRDLALLEVAIRTAANIVKVFPNPYLIAAAAALGVSETAAILAKPLPKYAKGRGKGKAEFAIVGEAGQEAIIRDGGKVEITPNKATTTFLNPNDQVISNSELMRSIQNSAYISLSNKGTFTTDKLQNALINEFEKNTNEIKDLKKVLINKNLSVNTTNYGGFDSYLKANIR